MLLHQFAQAPEGFPVACRLALASIDRVKQAVDGLPSCGDPAHGGTDELLELLACLSLSEEG